MRENGYSGCQQQVPRNGGIEHKKQQGQSDFYLYYKSIADMHASEGRWREAEEQMAKAYDDLHASMGIQKWNKKPGSREMRF